MNASVVQGSGEGVHKTATSAPNWLLKAMPTMSPVDESTPKASDDVYVGGNRFCRSTPDAAEPFHTNAWKSGVDGLFHAHPTSSLPEMPHPWL